MMMIKMDFRMDLSGKTSMKMKIISCGIMLKTLVFISQLVEEKNLLICCYKTKVSWCAFGSMVTHI